MWTKIATVTTTAFAATKTFAVDLAASAVANPWVSAAIAVAVVVAIAATYFVTKWLKAKNAEKNSTYVANQTDASATETATA